LLIERKNDSTMTNPGYRWWSNPGAFSLQHTHGLVSFTVPLSGDNWSNVSGVTAAADPSDFAAALADAGPVGMTFGGGCFFGHGVYMSLRAPQRSRSGATSSTPERILRGIPVCTGLGEPFDAERRFTHDSSLRAIALSCTRLALQSVGRI
jgi:hypothetical protein